MISGDALPSRPVHGEAPCARAASGPLGFLGGRRPSRRSDDAQLRTAQWVAPGLLPSRRGFCEHIRFPMRSGGREFVKKRIRPGGESSCLFGGFRNGTPSTSWPFRLSFRRNDTRRGMSPGSCTAGSGGTSTISVLRIEGTAPFGVRSLFRFQLWQPRSRARDIGRRMCGQPPSVLRIEDTRPSGAFGTAHIWSRSVISGAHHTVRKLVISFPNCSPSMGGG